MDAAFLYFGGLRIFVLVDHVLVDRVRHQLLDLILNPGRAEGREILARIPVQQKFVPDKGIGRTRFGSTFRHPKLGQDTLRRLGCVNVQKAGVVG